MVLAYFVIEARIPSVWGFKLSLTILPHHGIRDQSNSRHQRDFPQRFLYFEMLKYSLQCSYHHQSPCCIRKGKKKRRRKEKTVLVFLSLMYMVSNIAKIYHRVRLLTFYNVLFPKIISDNCK